MIGGGSDWKAKLLNNFKKKKRKETSTSPEVSRERTSQEAPLSAEILAELREQQKINKLLLEKLENLQVNTVISPEGVSSDKGSSVINEDEVFIPTIRDKGSKSNITLNSKEKSKNSDLDKASEAFKKLKKHKDK